VDRSLTVAALTAAALVPILSRDRQGAIPTSFCLLTSDS